MFLTRRHDSPTPTIEPAKQVFTPQSTNGSIMKPLVGAVLSSGVSITGSVKFRDQLVIDGEVKGNIDSTGTLTIGKYAHIRGDIKTKSATVQGTVEGDIVASERCELQSGCSFHGDIEAPRLVVNEDATFVGSAKVAQK